MSKRFVTQIESDVPNGTAPIIVDSSTLVANLNADLLDGQHGSYYAPIASPTFTGTVSASVMNISGIFTTSNYINRTTVNGNSSWLQQDGTGRTHWYWNTLGGTSPTFTNAAEDASALTLHVNNNGNGGSFFHRSVNGASASAGGAISWTTTLYVDLNNITFKGTPLALTSGATFTGTIVSPAATTSISSIRLPHGTAPTSPTNGDLWTTTSGLFARINGSTVGPFIDSSSVGSAVVSVSDTAPSTANGKLWYNSSNGRTYVYYQDGSSNQWVEIGTASLDPVANYDGGTPSSVFGGVSSLDGGGVT